MGNFISICNGNYLTNIYFQMETLICIFLAKTNELDKAENNQIENDAPSAEADMDNEFSDNDLISNSLRST